MIFPVLFAYALLLLLLLSLVVYLMKTYSLHRIYFDSIIWITRCAALLFIFHFYSRALVADSNMSRMLREIDPTTHIYGCMKVTSVTIDVVDGWVGGV